MKIFCVLLFGRAPAKRRALAGGDRGGGAWRSEFFAGLFEQLDPRADVVAVVVIGAAADEVAVDHAGLVDVRAAAGFEIEAALGDGRHAAALDAIGVGRDLDTVADTGNRL